MKQWVHIFAVCFFALCLRGAELDVAPFTWPAGVSNRGPYPEISSTNIVVMSPSGSSPTENDLESYRYHHVAKVSWQSNTTWIVMNAHGTHEQGDGTQVHGWYSTNRGATWSATIQIYPSFDPMVNTISTTGTVWAIPNTFAVVGGTNYLIADVTQETVDSEWQSRLLLACAMFPNGTVGARFRISPNSWSNNYPVISNLTYDATLGNLLLTQSQIYGTYGGSYGNSTTNMQWSSFFKTNSNTLIEPNTVSADGGATNFYRLCRVLGGYTGGFTNDQFLGQYWTTNGVYWNANSAINAGLDGLWSAPYITSIPNPSSETALLRLTDGRFVILGNPHNWPGDTTVRRDPLFLGITAPSSHALTNVWAVRQYLTNMPTYDGNSKRGGAQYPAMVQVGNYLYTTYSITKEKVGFSRILIPDLTDNNNDYEYSSNSVTLSLSGQSILSGKVTLQ